MCRAMLVSRGGVNGNFTLSSYTTSEHYSAIYISVVQCYFYITVVSINYIFKLQLGAVVFLIAMGYTSYGL